MFLLSPSQLSIYNLSFSTTAALFFSGAMCMDDYIHISTYYYLFISYYLPFFFFAALKFVTARRDE